MIAEVCPRSGNLSRVSPLAIVVLLLMSWPLLGQDADVSASDPVARFFADNPRSQSYEEARSELVRVFDAARARNLPLTSLSTLLHEAAAKRVPADRLTAALEGEVERLETARSILRTAGLRETAPGGKTRESTLRQMSVHMQVGVGETVMRQVAEDAQTLEQFTEAAAALASVASASHVLDESLTELGRALIGSSLDPSGYGAVSSAYIKGRVLGLAPREVTELVVRVLGAGGGIIQIDRELNARRRR
ncbi:MAG: hypothetical protein GVY29_00665 [Spirochaetes bacterium]|jgi:hypothetical protein|nr:hypothetical protein [Spirochaetota bacterium]